ncbi:MAG: hypothetical protein JST09_10090 [Bacteroidetes bacterium]|nr:hypothetical protein [Bacteroidota bacterium]
MELDALKEIWQEADKKNESAPPNNEIMEMLNKSPKSPVAKMMRNVLIEMTLIIVLFGGVALFYFIAFDKRFISIAWVYIITASVYTFYYFLKWRLLRSMQCVACQVKGNLQRQVNKLTRYVRFYLISGTFVVPVVFIFLGFLFYFKFPEGALKPIFPPVKELTMYTWAKWLIFLTGITLFAWWGNRYFINKLYGQHILRIKQLLSQMEE